MIYSPGMQIYKYSLVQMIGKGQFGEVWTAVDTAINGQLAVKLLDKQLCSIDERLIEARIGNRLIHPNVVNIKNADVVCLGLPPTPVVIIAMPYYVNGSVASKINAANFLDLTKALKCIIDVLRGLEYLHENGYYHCDIKPQNILVGNNGEYVLSDYGITCYSPTHTAVQPRKIYIPHAAAESISDNRYDARTDIYQLGLTAFRLINGISTISETFAKEGDAFAQTILKGKVISDVNFQPFVPHRLRRIMLKATNLNPDERYQTALEMRRDLEKIDVKGGEVTSDEHGKIIVKRHKYEYYYEASAKRKGNIAFNALKRNTISGRVTRVSAFSCKVKNQSEAKKAAQNFFLGILT